MRELVYDRAAAVKYARRWAMASNPAYYNFENIGGDCTNFVSQCIFAGAGVMNFTRDVGWYYRSSSDRAAAWSGVVYLYRFLVTNAGAGPRSRVTARSEAEPGDVVQLGTSDGVFYHTAIITETAPVILIAAHTFAALDRPLSSYSYDVARFLHIEGVRED